MHRFGQNFHQELDHWILEYRCLYGILQAGNNKTTSSLQLLTRKFTSSAYLDLVHVLMHAGQHQGEDPFAEPEAAAIPRFLKSKIRLGKSIRLGTNTY